MAKKLGEYTLPTGATGSIFSLGDLLSLILGTAVLLMTFAAGQKLTQSANKVMPAALRDDIDPIIKTPVSAPTNQKIMY